MCVCACTHVCVCVSFPPDTMHWQRHVHSYAHTPLWRSSMQPVHVTVEMMYSLYINTMGSWHRERSKFMGGCGCGMIVCVCPMEWGRWAINLKTALWSCSHVKDRGFMERIWCIILSSIHCKKESTPFIPICIVGLKQWCLIPTTDENTLFNQSAVEVCYTHFFKVTLTNVGFLSWWTTQRIPLYCIFLT